MKSFFLFEVEDTTDAAVDVAIPDPSVAGPGSEILVRDKSDGSNAVTVTPDAGTIEGSAFATVPSGGMLRLLSDGVEWMDVAPAGSFSGGTVPDETTFSDDVTVTGAFTALGAPVNLNSLFSIDLYGVIQAGINGGDFKIDASGTNFLANVPGDKIAEYGAAGASRMAHLATVDDNTKAVAFCEALRLYLIARGTMAAS